MFNPISTPQPFSNSFQAFGKLTHVQKEALDIFLSQSLHIGTAQVSYRELAQKIKKELPEALDVTIVGGVACQIIGAKTPFTFRTPNDLDFKIFLDPNAPSTRSFEELSDVILQMLHTCQFNSSMPIEDLGDFKRYQRPLVTVDSEQDEWALSSYHDDASHPEIDFLFVKKMARGFDFPCNSFVISLFNHTVFSLTGNYKQAMDDLSHKTVRLIRPQELRHGLKNLIKQIASGFTNEKQETESTLLIKFLQEMGTRLEKFQETTQKYLQKHYAGNSDGRACYLVNLLLITRHRCSLEMWQTIYTSLKPLLKSHADHSLLKAFLPSLCHSLDLATFTLDYLQFITLSSHQGTSSGRKINTKEVVHGERQAVQIVFDSENRPASHILFPNHPVEEVSCKLAQVGKTILQHSSSEEIELLLALIQPEKPESIYQEMLLALFQKTSQPSGLTHLYQKWVQSSLCSEDLLKPIIQHLQDSSNFALIARILSEQAALYTSKRPFYFREKMEEIFKHLLESESLDIDVLRTLWDYGAHLLSNELRIAFLNRLIASSEFPLQERAVDLLSEPEPTKKLGLSVSQRQSCMKTILNFWANKERFSLLNPDNQKKVQELANEQLSTLSKLFATNKKLTKKDTELLKEASFPLFILSQSIREELFKAQDFVKKLIVLAPTSLTGILKESFQLILEQTLSSSLTKQNFSFLSQVVTSLGPDQKYLLFKLMDKAVSASEESFFDPLQVLYLSVMTKHQELTQEEQSSLTTYIETLLDLPQLLNSSLTVLQNVVNNQILSQERLQRLAKQLNSQINDTSSLSQETFAIASKLIYAMHPELYDQVISSLTASAPKEHFLEIWKSMKHCDYRNESVISNFLQRVCISQDKTFIELAQSLFNALKESTEDRLIEDALILLRFLDEASPDSVLPLTSNAKILNLLKKEGCIEKKAELVNALLTKVKNLPINNPSTLLPFVNEVAALSHPLNLGIQRQLDEATFYLFIKIKTPEALKKAYARLIEIQLKRSYPKEPEQIATYYAELIGSHAILGVATEEEPVCYKLWKSPSINQLFSNFEQLQDRVQHHLYGYFIASKALTHLPLMVETLKSLQRSKLSQDPQTMAAYTLALIQKWIDSKDVKRIATFLQDPSTMELLPLLQASQECQLKAFNLLTKASLNQDSAFLIIKLLQSRFDDLFRKHPCNFIAWILNTTNGVKKITQSERATSVLIQLAVMVEYVQSKLYTVDSSMSGEVYKTRLELYNTLLHIMISDENCSQMTSQLLQNALTHHVFSREKDQMLSLLSSFLMSINHGARDMGSMLDACELFLAAKKNLFSECPKAYEIMGEKIIQTLISHEWRVNPDDEVTSSKDEHIAWFANQLINETNNLTGSTAQLLFNLINTLADEAIRKRDPYLYPSIHKIYARCDEKGLWKVKQEFKKVENKLAKIPKILTISNNNSSINL